MKPQSLSLMSEFSGMSRLQKKQFRTATSDSAKKALSYIGNLKGCEAHSSCMLTSAEDRFMRSLGINLTCEPKFPGTGIYFNW